MADLDKTVIGAEHIEFEAPEPVLLTPDEGTALGDVLRSFVNDYAHKGQGVSDEQWLLDRLRTELPGKDDAELQSMCGEIAVRLRDFEAAQKSLRSAREKGMSTESWFAREGKKALGTLSVTDQVKYLRELDESVRTANAQLLDTITTKSGEISQATHLDGFIAEEMHAQTFNMNAAALGSEYRAEVLKPNGAGYAKNSVDIVIKDRAGKTVRRYQSKYGKDAATTARMFDKGDYRGQRSLVPEDQSSEIVRKHSTTLEAPDGTQSEPLSRLRARQLQEEAQSGKWNDKNWNDYKTADVLRGVAKNAAKAGAMGCAVGAGFELARQCFGNEEFDGEKVVQEGLKTGADFGVKSAVAGGLKVASEKGLISLIPKGTSTNALTAIAYVGIENVKVLSRVASGELSVEEGVEQSAEVSASTLIGLKGSAMGAAKGAAVLAFLGPIGAAVGGFAGGIVGYMAGSAVGTACVKITRKMRRYIKKHIVMPALNAMKKAASGIWEGAKSLGRAVASLFSWF